MTVSSIEEKGREVVQEFALFDDWLSKYEYLIELGRALPPLDEVSKTEAFRIHGCQSNVWVRPVLEAGRVVYRADSDALITRGLAALLVRVLSGEPPDAIAETDLAFLDAIGMHEHLSPHRKNGLALMINHMKRYARAFSEADPA